MRTQSPDTDFQTEVALIAMLRKAKPHKKFAQVRSLSQTVLSLSRRAIARKHPHLDEADLHGLFVHHQYGQDLGDRFTQYLKSRRDERA